MLRNQLFLYIIEMFEGFFRLFIRVGGDSSLKNSDCFLF